MARKPKVRDITSDVMTPKLTLKFEASPSQRRAAKAFNQSDILILSGEAGTGKSHIATILALQHAIKNNCSVTLTRPVVEAGGEHLGFLPGGIDEKLGPYLLPIHAIISKIASDPKAAKTYFDAVPLAFMRGVTIDGVLLLDEAQNASFSQILLALTRIGKGAKAILTGDSVQTDLGGDSFLRIMEMLDGVPGITIIDMDSADQQRNPVVTRILDRIAEFDDDSYEDRAC